MRNHLKQWLKLLQWSSFLTLLAAAWLSYKHHSPLGNHFKLDDKLAGWFNITDPAIINYSMIGIAVFLGISALCSFRCGNYYKPKYVIPVLISALLLIATLVLYVLEQTNPSLVVATFIIPASVPLLLISYQNLKNQVDYWSVWACLLIAATIAGYSYQSLTNPSGIPTPSGIPMRMSELSPELNALIVTSVAYVAIGTAVALFIPTFRRLALYLSIILGLTISGATVMSYFSTSQPFSNLDLWLPMLTLISAYWILPILILFSLASHRKTMTLKL